MKKIIWVIVIVLGLLAIWWVTKSPATAPVSDIPIGASENDTVSGINQDLQGISSTDLDAEFQSIDKDLNSL